ncbi:MAG: GNAT family N-acetyltransferase [Cyanobacteria bacterium P01_G01_bin.67]
MFRCKASRWGQVEDFLIVERNGKAVATCAVFCPSELAGANSPLDLSKLPHIAKSLGWSIPTIESFEQAYVEIWEADPSFLKPQADMIVETVAVLPSHRGSGLGHSLMKAAFERAQQQGANSLGVMVVHGNKPAQSLYEKYFERYTTFYPAYFNYTLPGLTKYRASLSS